MYWANSKLKTLVSEIVPETRPTQRKSKSSREERKKIKPIERSVEGG